MYKAGPDCAPPKDKPQKKSRCQHWIWSTISYSWVKCRNYVTKNSYCQLHQK